MNTLAGKLEVLTLLTLMTDFWFLDLQIRSFLTFGYEKKNKNKNKNQRTKASVVENVGLGSFRPKTTFSFFPVSWTDLN